MTVCKPCYGNQSFMKFQLRKSSCGRKNRSNRKWQQSCTFFFHLCVCVCVGIVSAKYKLFVHEWNLFWYARHKYFTQFLIANEGWLIDVRKWWNCEWFWMMLTETILVPIHLVLLHLCCLGKELFCIDVVRHPSSNLKVRYAFRLLDDFSSPKINWAAVALKLFH